MKYSEAFEEFVADSMEKMLTDQNAVEKLAMLRTKDKSVFDKLREGIQKLVDRIKQEYAKLTPDSAEGRTVATMTDVFSDIQDLFLEALDDASNNFQKAEKNTATDDGVQYSEREIIGLSGKNYGVGVYLDSNLLTGLTEDERKEMLKEFVISELAGKYFIAYDNDNNAVDIGIATKGDSFKNQNGRKHKVLKELYRKHSDVIVKQEAVVLTEELISNAKYTNSLKPKYSHGWFDNNGKNDWEYWKVFIQEKNKTVWEATLNIANTANGEKILYDIDPIKIVEGAIKSAPTTTNNSVSQEKPIVNNNSMQEDENNTQKKFSLRENVEETKDLVAVHNLSAEKLLKSLNLGGLPMPSIAIMKAKDGHNQFGDISLVFRKDTIDLEADKSNKVYERQGTVSCLRKNPTTKT